MTAVMTRPTSWMPVGPLLALFPDDMVDREIARRCGVHIRQVQRWRHGSGTLRWDCADKVATALGMHPSNIWSEW